MSDVNTVIINLHVNTAIINWYYHASLLTNLMLLTIIYLHKDHYPEIII